MADAGRGSPFRKARHMRTPAAESGQRTGPTKGSEAGGCRGQPRIDSAPGAGRSDRNCRGQPYPA
eukprot:6371765-Alexandrium_andersonii.AAC.1